MFLTVSFAFGAEPEKPVCNAHIRGKLWPEKSVRGAGVPVEMCEPKGFKYAWRALTVNVAQLKAAAKRKAVLAAGTQQETAPAPPE